MAAIKSLYKVPIPSVEFEGGGAYMCGDTIRYEYFRDRVIYRSGIRFKSMAAIRIRAERCCTVTYIEGVYDTLSEVENSSWVAEIRADTQEQWRNHWNMRHFMIYLDSSGCFEVIADDWDALPEEKGAWSDISLQVKGVVPQ